MRAVLLSALLSVGFTDQLTYTSGGTGDISEFAFSWSNPDRSATVLTGPDDEGAVEMTDGFTSGGYRLVEPSGVSTWGDGGDPSNSVALTGSFVATSLNPGTDMQYFSITSMSISFTSTQTCFSSSSTATAYYDDWFTNSRVELGSATVDTSSGVTTFTASFSSAGPTTGEIGFDVTSNTYCSEAEIDVVEFTLEGVAAATPKPTGSPTPSPSDTPTLAPISSCTGQVTWGDPHFHPLATDESIRFDYQGLGWYYYSFPCEAERDYNNWPFFLLSEHQQCYWQGNPRGCIGANKLILNTKPEPWVIDFFTSTITIERGSDTINDPITFSTSEYTASDDALVINYDDGYTPSTSGELRIYYKDGMIYIEIWNSNYVPFGGDDDSCNDHLITISNKASYTIMTCPTCLRNHLCGITGKYARGDCTSSDMKVVGSDCRNILTAPDGTVFVPSNGAPSNTQFIPFADTWNSDEVDAYLATLTGVTPIGVSFEHMHEKMDPRMEARLVAESLYEGECENNQLQIDIYNELCRQATVVQWEDCCAEIGICDMLWDACVEDMCACTMFNDEDVQMMGSEDCLQLIVGESMNTSCSFDALFPTDAPTNAPTSSPIDFGSAATTVEETLKLIGLYAIFVVLFVVIAIAACVYYRKKNRGKVYMPEDDEDVEINETGTGTYE